MSEQKQNDVANWKNKLSDLDSLPGDSVFNKNTAWESLHDRLHKEPHRKKAIWYWAAASLLPVMLLLWVANNKKEMIAVTTNPQQQNKTSPLPHLPLDKKEVMVVSTPVFSVKNRPLKNINNSLKAVVAGKAVHAKKESPSIAAVIPEKIPVVVHSIAPPADTAVAAIAVVKKKLPVVHINELEPAPEVLTTVTGHGQKSFRLIFNKIKSNNTTAAATLQYAGVKVPLTN